MGFKHGREMRFAKLQLRFPERQLAGAFAFGIHAVVDIVIDVIFAALSVNMKSFVGLEPVVVLVWMRRRFDTNPPSALARWLMLRVTLFGPSEK